MSRDSGHGPTLELETRGEMGLGDLGGVGPDPREFGGLVGPVFSRYSNGHVFAVRTMYYFNILRVLSSLAFFVILQDPGLDRPTRALRKSVIYSLREL